MSSNQGQRAIQSKASNVQGSSVPAPASQAYGGASLDSSSTRRAAAGSPAGTPSVRNFPTPKNNQSRKPQHKRHRKPRLADEDAFAESVAMKSTTSRKGQTSITHLMSFALPARPHHGSHHHHHHYSSYHPSNRGRRSGWGLRASSNSVDKARYVHANYRFIVNPQNSYHAQATNADVHLDWNSVLQILVSTITQESSCPICLCTPVAPRMAKCGHIFCLPCLIRYMHSTDETNPVPEKRARWKKCPICWDSVFMSETRPVGWHAGQQTDSLFEGGDVVLRLVARRPGSTLALPRDATESLRIDDDIPWHHVADVPDYARIMKGGEEYMISQYDAEIEALQKQEQEDELYFGEDSTWTQKAIASIRDAKERVKGIGNPPDMVIESSQPVISHRPIKFEALAEGVPDMYFLQHAVKSGQSSSRATPPERATPPSADLPPPPALATSTTDISNAISNLSAGEPRREDAAAPNKRFAKHHHHHHGHPQDQPYYFYQALPHFYLSSLDIRILKAAFGDFSQFPSTILPRIEHISTGHIVDEELRRRTKYLNHLPYGCEVSFLECDWTDVVSLDILNKFSDEITKRRKRNAEKAIREEKESMRAEKEEEKRWTAARRRRSSITTESHDRPFTESDFLPLGLGVAAGDVDTTLSSVSPPWSSSLGAGGDHPFAALASPSSSPPTRRTVWGTVAVASSSDLPLVHDPLPPSRDDGWLHNWEDELLLAERQEAAALDEGQVTSGPTPSSGKKKRGKKITLMSTNARRAA